VLEQLNGFYAGQQVQLASDSLVTKFLAHTGLWRNDESSLLVLQPEFVTWLVEGQGRGADEGGHRRSWRCANNQRSDGGRRPQRRG
jgi:hypothetical protein